MELIKPNLNFDFLGKSAIFISLSLACIAFSIYQWISLGEQKYDVDYKGGAQITVKIETKSSVEDIRRVLAKEGSSNALVQAFEDGEGEFSIRLGEVVVDEKEARKKIETALNTEYSGKFTIEKADFVGPTVGNELLSKAKLAVIIALVGMLFYITWRFEFAFALGAVVALFHDVTISTGFYLADGRLINASTLAAALTIVGYSVNDTIVIFDRVREEIYKQKKFELVPLINKAINETLSRTIITSLLTFFSALALLVVGGGAISDLSFYMVVGIVTGSYSTIFIASPVVIMWEKWRGSLAKRVA